MSLEMLIPVLMACALLWWVGRRLTWTQRLMAVAVTLAVIVAVLWVERNGVGF